jgi:hypothetical protein
MATLLAHDAKREDWAEPRVMLVGEQPFTHAEWLWPLIGLALLGALLAFIVDEYPLRTLIAVH